MISHECGIVIFFPLIYDIPCMGDCYFFPLIYDIPWVGDCYFFPSDLWYPMSGGLLFFSLWYMISHEWVIVIFFPLIYDIPWVGDCYFFSSDIWYPMSGGLLFFFLRGKKITITHSWDIIYQRKKNNNHPLMGYHISEGKK
jgi:hypothetical protein